MMLLFQVMNVMFLKEPQIIAFNGFKVICLLLINLMVLMSVLSAGEP